MAVHWLRFQASNSGGMDSIPHQGTKIPSCHGAWPKDKKKRRHLKLMRRWTILYMMLGQLGSHPEKVKPDLYLNSSTKTHVK